MRRFVLTLIGEVIAVATGEQLAACIELGDAAAAIDTVSVDRTHKPGASPSKVAIGPFQGNVLLYAFPLLLTV